MYAIKFLKTPKYKHSYYRFCDEIKILRSLKKQKNKGVIPIIDTNIDKEIKLCNNSLLYYVMPLAKPLSNIKQISIEDRINIINQLFEALIFLHKNKIAHRDLKIANILNLNDKYVLSDFGLVYYEGKKRITKKREVMGAKGFFASEMSWSGALSDEDFYQADVCAFAKIIWAILVGSEKSSFMGQYNSNGTESLWEHLPQYNIFKLEQLMRECTSYISQKHKRPSIIEMKNMFNEWYEESTNDVSRKQGIWYDCLLKIFGTTIPIVASWSKDCSFQILDKICNRNQAGYAIFDDQRNICKYDSIKSNIMKLIFINKNNDIFTSYFDIKLDNNISYKIHLYQN